VRAAVFHEVGQPLSIENVPDPAPGAGEIVIEVRRSGICGSDLHWTQTPGIVAPGMILGHEFSGVVVDANGSGHGVGSKVTALPIFPCWSCSECAEGHIFHCTTPAVVGLTRPGAFARALSVDARLVQELPAGVDFSEGALIEPLAVGYRTVSQARAIKGAKVIVMGAGPIGSAVILFAVLGGASIVVASEPSAGRRKMAMELGATAAFDPGERDVRAQFVEAYGAPPDLVFECVGVPGVIPEAIRLVRSRGQIVSAGGCYTMESFLPIDALTKELTVSFSCAYEVSDFEAVTDALARERISPRPLVTDVITLDELPRKFEQLRRPSTQCKVLVNIE
jgi:(R,R)-butanediol dehydrogenase/meso-butanediol dehydrogenase/diacetyl reductase